MAAAAPPDDVSALMKRVELDRSQYKVFDGRQGSQIESGAASPRAAHSSVRIPFRVPTPAADSPAQIQETSRPRWNLLNSLLATENDDSVGAQPEALLVPMLSFSAGSGGVGKTTILSTVARVLSGMGESVFLVYSDSQHSLPLHFGGQKVVPGRVRTFIPPARESGQLHLYARPQEESGISEEVGCWLPREVNALASEVGRVLCEVTNSEIPESEVLDLSLINLRVLVPDISSVLAVNRDLAELDRGQDSNSHLTYYLLNQYDSAVPFHKDVRERLRMVLGDRLLPFTIRRTDQIPEALAAGVTVVDYAPNAPVVEDFKLMAQWIRNSMMSNQIEPVRRVF
jgi:cellulose biosynthesis protein BcsQ